MATSERRKKQIAQMKSTILEAAGQLFNDNGYKETTLRKIADTIDYNPATIYNYYGNKEEIFFALQERAFSKFYEEFIPLYNTDLIGLDRLKMMGETYINFALRNPLDYELMFIMKSPMNAAERLDPEWKIGEKNYELLKQVIQEGITEKSFYVENVEATAFMIWSTMHGLASLFIMDRMQMIEEDKRTELLSEAFNLFDHLLRKL